MKKCYLLCNNPVSELGAYVKISNKAYAHLACFRKAHAYEVRNELAADALQKNADDAERQRTQAENAWRAAPRCPKCGVPMLSERPKSLPDAFSTVLTSNGVTCTLCVRQEVSLRHVARGREAPAPAPAPAPVPVKTIPLFTPAELKEMGVPAKSADEELVRKARESGNPAIEVD